MRSVWYVLEDGSVVDPNEVAHDDKGVLRHTGGKAVAMRNGVPHTSGVDLESSAKPAAKSDGGKHAGKDMKAEGDKQPYKTRESKAK